MVKLPIRPKLQINTSNHLRSERRFICASTSGARPEKISTVTSWCPCIYFAYSFFISETESDLFLSLELE